MFRFFAEKLETQKFYLKRRMCFFSPKTNKELDSGVFLTRSVTRFGGVSPLGRTVKVFGLKLRAYSDWAKFRSNYGSLLMRLG